MNSEAFTKAMNECARFKTWTIPAHGKKGPITFTLRLPEITIQDSCKREIVIAPEQAESAAVVLASIKCWLTEGDAPWFPQELRAR